jgi:hypothetical protein
MRLDRAAMALAAALISTTASADDAGGPRRAPAASADAARVPPGHPTIPAEEPHAHEGEDPHAGGATGGPEGAGPGEMFQAPADGAVEDVKLAPGTVTVQILDAEGKALPNTDVTLGIIYNSVAKGESRKRVVAKTGPTGHVKFDGQDTGTGVAYRAMVLKDGATFSMPPFQLPAKAGMRGVLHVYPVETDITKTLVVSQSMTYVEVKDDRIQIQQAYKIYNFGKVAWLPQDHVLALPPSYTAFAAQQGMTDVGAEALPKKGVKLRGTFAPGEHVVEFRWQLPYNGEGELQFDIGMPPHLAASRVIAPAARTMELEVEGFPAAQPTRDGMGQRALMTERNMRRDDTPVGSIRVQIRGLPTEGPAKIFATLLAGVGVMIGLVLGARRPPLRDMKTERAKLLAELKSLERAREAGDVGPKTYERARRELLDDLARTFAEEPEPAPAKKSPKTARA